MYEPALEPEPPAEETKEEIAVVEEKDSNKSKRKSKSKGGRKKSPSPTAAEEQKGAPQPTPSSWASMVAHNSSNPPSPVRRTEKKEREALAKEETKPEKQTESQQHQGNKQQRGPKLRDPDCTLVIKHVPEGTRDREIREIFERFATETHSKIIGLNFAGNRSLAFVDYDSPEPVLLALKDKGPFQLNGRDLEVEPKMVDKSRSKGSGGRYRGQSGGTDTGGSSNGFRGSGRGSGQHRRRGSGGKTERGGGGRGGRSGGK